MKIALMDVDGHNFPNYALMKLARYHKEKGYRVDFNQAMDARLVTEDIAKLLAKVKWLNGFCRFGCDTPKQGDECMRTIDLMRKYGYEGQVLFYTIIMDLEETYNRISRIRNADIKRFRVQAQPYIEIGKSHNIQPQWRKDMARWANKRMLFYSCDFKDFSPRKGFKCSSYFEK